MTYMLVPSGIIVSIELDEDGWLLAWAHDLPGCVAQGRSVGEAIQGIAEAVEDALEVIRQDRHLGSDVAHGSGPSTESYSGEAEIRIASMQAA